MMISIPIDQNALDLLEVNFVQWTFLVLMNRGHVELAYDVSGITKDDLEILARKKHIKVESTLSIKYPKISIQGLALNLLDVGNDMDSLVNEFREIFPSGIKSGGYLVRGDKEGCKRKLKKFKSKYPEYSNTQILEATKKYVREKQLEGWKFMQLAHYFIEKDGNSSLAAYCENLSDNSEGSFEENIN